MKTIEEVNKFCKSFVKDKTGKKFAKNAPDPERAILFWSACVNKLVDRVIPLLKEYKKKEKILIPLEKKILFNNIWLAFKPMWDLIRKEYQLEERLLDFREGQREKSLEEDVYYDHEWGGAEETDSEMPD